MQTVTELNHLVDPLDELEKPQAYEDQEAAEYDWI